MHESLKDLIIYPSAEIIPKVFWELANISLQKQRWEESEEKSVEEWLEKRIGLQQVFKCSSFSSFFLFFLPSFLSSSLLGIFYRSFYHLCLTNLPFSANYSNVPDQTHNPFTEIND